MADIKTITQELTDASLNLTNAVNTITGNSMPGDYEEIKNILNKVLEKLDELVTKANA